MSSRQRGPAVPCPALRPSAADRPSRSLRSSKPSPRNSGRWRSRNWRRSSGAEADHAPHRAAARRGRPAAARAEPPRLRPGSRLLNFALGAVQSSMRSAPRHAVLEALSAKVGETCNFGMMSGNAILYLDRVEASWPFGLKFEWLARAAALHVGRQAFVSVQPRRRRDELIRTTPLPRYTENTITDPDALHSELDEIRKRGYSIDNQEFLAGVVCLAGRYATTRAWSAPASRSLLLTRACRWLNPSVTFQFCWRRPASSPLTWDRTRHSAGQTNGTEL